MIPKEVFEQTILQFFAPIVPFLDDASVSEVMINGPDQIYIERKGQLELTNARFPSREALLAALRNLSQFVGKNVSEERPILEGRLPDGSRVEALIPPVAPDGPHVAIRRFFKETLTVQRLVEFGSMPGIAAASLQAFVISKLNVIIAGGTGSGKTSMLNALSSFIPDGERVVVIEDSREIQFQKPHVVQLEARPADPKGRGAVSIRDLFRATLRMRPDRVIVGEIRGGEALDIVQAMTSGHGGCMGTLHASYPKDTLTRLETMAMMSDVEMPLAAMRSQIGSGVQMIVQCSRLQDGSRKVTHITEVKGFDLEAQKYVLQDIFVRKYHGIDDKGKVISELVPSGVLPSCMHQLEEHGVTLPDPVFDAARSAGAQHHHGGPA
ncbi:MAG TPA: CpaF family protein [Polyangiaceae bacterium]|nr:CpaF family protein [Polyangiaceae bacterium]